MAKRHKGKIKRAGKVENIEKKKEDVSKDILKRFEKAGFNASVVVEEGKTIEEKVNKAVEKATKELPKDSSQNKIRKEAMKKL